VNGASTARVHVDLGSRILQEDCAVIANPNTMDAGRGSLELAGGDIAMQRIRFGMLGLVASGVLCIAAPAAAQQSPATSAPAAGSTEAAGANNPHMEEARQRYQRGLQLFNEANYDAARVEFERAYQLAPSYKILYNIGLCYEQLGDYVQAQTTLQRYLEQGGSEISAERRNEVAKELAQIRPRIARVTVHANVSGAEILVDDACSTEANTGNVNCGAVVGTSRVVLMNPGRRRVTLRHVGYLPETQIVTVAGSDTVDVNVDLKPLPKLVEKKTNPFTVPMWIGWGVTAAGAATTIVFGVLAENARSDQEAANNTFGRSRDELDDARSKTQTLSTVSDVALIGTAVAAGASTYFLIRSLGWKGANANVEVGANHIGLSGTF
jgi:Tfp pilus assembly protein PilF